MLFTQNNNNVTMFVLTPPSFPQVCGEHAVRGARHLSLPRGLALGAAARPGPRHAGKERRHHLLHHTDLHLHAGARAAATLQRRRSHHTGRELQPAHQQQPGGRRRRLRPQQHLRGSHVLVLHRRSSSRGLLTHTRGRYNTICLERKRTTRCMKTMGNNTEKLTHSEVLRLDFGYKEAEIGERKERGNI